MIDLFRTDNTEGYTDEQLAALNSEWAERVAADGLEEGTIEYEDAAKAFADEVARR